MDIIRSLAFLLVIIFGISAGLTAFSQVTSGPLGAQAFLG